MIKVCVLVKENDLPFSSESMSFHYNVLVIRVISCMSHVLKKPVFFLQKWVPIRYAVNAQLVSTYVCAT